jgi:ribonuclease BN (tRNA processing enzyme)
MKCIIVIFIVAFSFQSLKAQRTDSLQLTIVGSGSPVFNENRASSSYLISNGTTQILVDMGNGSQRNLNKLNIIDKNLDALLITHHHLDHNEELVPIFIHTLLGRKNILVAGPTNTTNFITANLELYKEDINYRLSKTQRNIADRLPSLKTVDLKGNDSFYINDIKVSTCKVNHTIYTIAYKFEFGGKTIIITGDLTYTKELAVFANNADYMVIDAGGMIMQNGKGAARARKRQARKKGVRQPNESIVTTNENRQTDKYLSNGVNRELAHVDLHESSLMAKEANVKTIVYSHFTTGEINKEASIAAIRKNFSGNVIFGADLMVVNASLIQ